MRALRIVMLVLLVGIGLNVNAQHSLQKFVTEIDYFLYLPENYNVDTTVKQPLLMFLHGAGEVGANTKHLTIHGPSKLISEGKQFPFIVVAPQARTHGWNPDYLYELLQDIKKKYRVDDDRVYLTGLSMGGFGTWEMAMKYPTIFAAIIPICGGGDTTDVWKLDKVPVWCFHGALDGIVPLSSSERMVNALRKYQPDVKFTIYPDVYHDSWVRAYNNDSIYSWLLEHKRYKNEQVTLPESLMKEYAGKYVMNNEKKDEIDIIIEGNELKGMNGENQWFRIKAVSKDKFFFDDYWRGYLVFERDEKGKITGFADIHGPKTYNTFKRID